MLCDRCAGEAGVERLREAVFARRRGGGGCPGGGGGFRGRRDGLRVADGGGGRRRIQGAEAEVVEALLAAADGVAKAGEDGFGGEAGCSAGGRAGGRSGWRGWRGGRGLRGALRRWCWAAVMISAAADGVGARRSATKSAMVKSVSWPMAETTGRCRGGDGAGEGFVVEAGEVFGGASAPGDEDEVGFVQGEH